jgi:uncharacterized protein
MTTTTIDLGHVARDLNLPPEKVQRTVELLDDGNTVPFITRYRKDYTGGLDEEQIRDIQQRVAKSRQLAERKAKILKTIEAQGKLTPELADEIQRANTAKRLEDLYLPFKPKKQTLATIARERGLEPLAVEIFEAHENAADLQARVATFLSADRELHTTDDVLSGVGHLIAERIAEIAELRGRLRRIFQRSGRIVCTKVETPPGAAKPAPEESAELPLFPTESVASAGEQDSSIASAEPEVSPPAEQLLPSGEASSEPSALAVEEVSAAAPAAEALVAVQHAATALGEAAGEGQPLAGGVELPAAASEVVGSGNSPGGDVATGDSAAGDSATSGSDEVLPAGRLFEPPPVPVALPVTTLLKKKKKKKKKVVGEHAFKDYYNYSEPLGRVPPHRVLAINRGERAHAIRVGIDADMEAMFREAEQFLWRPDHPHLEFLRDCLRDALGRLIAPSLERELRREMTDRAEEHAVEVFVRNLRKLLLQPPTRNRRVLAIDPGFKSGSKLVALDEFGNVLAHGMIFVIGKDEERRKKARVRLAEMAIQHGVSVIAIGNGTGCRETEQLVADCLAEELAGRDVAYVVVNEAGASIYSTSPLGREELPQFDALQRGAISIGRRLLDPLSEMVKINPANLGVGLYQHDVKAKHLKESLDAVVESAVNFVGVDVNSASPALLRYISGMNALTARRVYEYRREHGPFRNREQLKEVSGLGEQSFIQAAGFLKVLGGENPLDATWIHPESYEIAKQVLAKIGCDEALLAQAMPAPTKVESRKQFAAELLADGPKSPESSESAAAVDEASAPPASDASVPADDSDSANLPPGQLAEPSSSNTHSVSDEAGSAMEPAAPADAAPANAAPADAAPVENAATPVPSADSASAAGEEVSPIASESGSSETAKAKGPSPDSTIQTARRQIAERASQVDIPALAAELQVGQHLLKDILTSLTRPGIDPRDNLPAPVFRRGIIKLEDLTPGMELSGTVLNVVDFGVFLDIGLSDSGLVHISRLADRYIKDPHEVVGVGDVLKVWVVDVDKNRRRVSLTAIAPGTERQTPQRGPRERPPQPQSQRSGPPPRGNRPPRAGSGEGVPAAAGGPPPARGSRPPRSGGGGRRDDRRGGRPSSPPPPRVIERTSTKPKKVKPITKAQEEGKEPMRSFSDLMQLFDKKKKPEAPGGEG